jgi:hypothetical protein
MIPIPVYRTLEDKINAYVDFYSAADTRVLVVVGLNGGGEGKSYALETTFNTIQKEKRPRFDIYFNDEGEACPVCIYAYEGGNPDPIYDSKMIYHLYPSDSSLVELLREKGGRVVFFEKDE